MSDVQAGLLPTSADAAEWSKSFCEHKRDNRWVLEDIDEGLMIGWFANYWAAVYDPFADRIAELEAENERLRRPACGTEQVWLDTIRHDDEQALLWFRSMQRESEAKKEAMQENERLREMNEHLADSDSAACLRDAERFRKISNNGWTISYRKKGVGVHKPMTNYPYELHPTLADAVDAMDNTTEETK